MCFQSNITQILNCSFKSYKLGYSKLQVIVNIILKLIHVLCKFYLPLITQESIKVCRLNVNGQKRKYRVRRSAQLPNVALGAACLANNLLFSSSYSLHHRRSHNINKGGIILSIVYWASASLSERRALSNLS